VKTFRIEKPKCKQGPNIYRSRKGEGGNLKRIVFGIVLMLLAVYSSATIVKVNSATGASIVISPDTTTSPSTTFMLDLTINNVADMYAWSVTLVYQKIVSMNLVDTINGTDFTDGTGLAIFKQEDYNSSCYRSYVARTLIDVTPGTRRPGVTGSGLVARLNFVAALNGTTAIECTGSEILNSQSNPITPITVTTPTITVATPQPSPPPSSVGGFSFSVAKAPANIGFALIGVGAIVIPVSIYLGIKRRKEKQ
jgi:hypothetical protein